MAMYKDEYPLCFHKKKQLFVKATEAGGATRQQSVPKSSSWQTSQGNDEPTVISTGYKQANCDNLMVI